MSVTERMVIVGVGITPTLRATITEDFQLGVILWEQALEEYDRFVQAHAVEMAAADEPGMVVVVGSEMLPASCGETPQE